MHIRPIRTKADYRAALKEVDRLWKADRGTPKGDRVEVLVTLIEAYEAKHHPIPAPDRGRVSEVLTRKRPLTLPMVRALSALLDIPTDVLVQQYETRSAA